MPIDVCLFVFLAEAAMPTQLVAVIFLAGGIEVVHMLYINGKDRSFLFYCIVFFVCFLIPRILQLLKAVCRRSEIGASRHLQK